MTHFQLCFTWAPSKGYRRSLCDWNQPVITFNNKIRLANDPALIRHHEEFKFFQIFRFHGEGIDSKHYGVLFFHEKFCQAVLICNLIMHHHILLEPTLQHLELTLAIYLSLKISLHIKSRHNYVH